MNEHIDYQTIEQDGKPVFAVVPYEQFQTLLHTSGVVENDEATIPHEVMRAVVVDGKSMVRAWREHLDMTQGELAEKASVSQPAIAQLETSDSEYRESTLKKLAIALGIEVDKLRPF